MSSWINGTYLHTKFQNVRTFINVESDGSLESGQEGSVLRCIWCLFWPNPFLLWYSGHFFHFLGLKIGARLVSTDIYFEPGRPNSCGRPTYMSPTYPPKMSPLAQTICEYNFFFKMRHVSGQFLDLE